MNEYVACERCDFGKGDYIEERYCVDKVLGEGTFGRVYRVRGVDGKRYAIKLLKLWEVVSPERPGLMRRFDMEYETGKIPSNYLVHSYSKGIVKNNPYIVMEYCPGGDLLEGIQRSNVNISVAAAEILYGLRDLHKCGKVHRDLKPENVLLREDSTAVLTDFGISGDQNKRMTERGWLGKPQQLFGTYGYMPPEQVCPPRGGNATVLPTTDIFSFGVMMYQLITGDLPFGRLQSESDLPSYIEHGKRGIWDRDRLRRTPHGKEWEKLIERCLVPDFKSRLQTTDEVLKLVPSIGSISSSEKRYRSISSDMTKPQLEVINGVLLRVMQGEEVGRVYKLDELITSNHMMLTMGRISSDIFNNIGIKEVDSCYVSRCHCTLEKNRENGCWVIRDGQWRNDCPTALRNPDYCKVCTAACIPSERAPFSWKRSMNGTYINSSEADSNGFYIQPGDIITIGDVKMRVEGY